jgi:carboxymethylenebutenolidase
VDQRIIDLYDEYTHAPLPRRVFMERLVVMVGTTAAAQMALGLLESNYALAQTVPESDPRLSTSMVEIAGVKAYQAVPKGTDPQSARGYHCRSRKSRPQSAYRRRGASHRA